VCENRSEIFVCLFSVKYLSVLDNEIHNMKRSWRTFDKQKGACGGIFSGEWGSHSKAVWNELLMNAVDTKAEGFLVEAVTRDNPREETSPITQHSVSTTFHDNNLANVARICPP
jgi:hypothetical protein